MRSKHIGNFIGSNSKASNKHLPNMNKHVRQESPGFFPSMRIIYEQLCDRARRICLIMCSIIAEQDDLHQRDQYHGDGWWPAGVFFFVGAVFIYENPMIA